MSSMGHFRTKKVNRYTLEEIQNQVDEAVKSVAKVGKAYYLAPREQHWLEKLDEALQNWGEWREALARKEDENQSVLDSE